MGDDRDHAGSVRRRGETAPQDLPGVAGEIRAAEAESALLDRDDGEVALWVRSSIWFGSILALLIGYLFLLPAPIIFLDDRSFFDGMPAAAEQVLEISIFPLIWLSESVSIYASYLDWLDDCLT